MTNDILTPRSPAGRKPKPGRDPVYTQPGGTPSTTRADRNKRKWYNAARLWCYVRDPKVGTYLTLAASIRMISVQDYLRLAIYNQLTADGHQPDEAMLWRKPLPKAVKRDRRA